MASSSSETQYLTLSQGFTDTDTNSKTHPNGVTETQTHSHSEKYSCKLPLSTFLGTKMPGGTFWQGKSSKAAYGNMGTDMPGKLNEGNLSISNK